MLVLDIPIIDGNIQIEFVIARKFNVHLLLITRNFA